MKSLAQPGTILLAAFMLVSSPVATLADGQELADLYQKAQELKRSNKLDEARALFESITEQGGEDSWGKLAEDELRYGLPLFEADNLVIKIGQSSRDPAQQDRYRQQAEALYKDILDSNPDEPDRIANVQRRLDQLAITRTYLTVSRDFQLRASLTPLRMSMRMHFSEYRKWPERNWLREELARVLGRARYSENKLTIEEYWTDKNRFTLRLLDASSRKVLVMEGDENNVTIEGDDSL